jgi:glycosyltransferase involved in cell wall biosynthesis
MKIIFGADAIKYPLTGIGRYAYELAKQLQHSADVSEFFFLNGRRISTSLPAVSELAPSSQGLRTLVKKSYIATELYRYVFPWLKARTLNQYPEYIYHSPNFYLPKCAGRTVATFHDLSVFTWPECHPKERVRYMQKELRLTLERASALITDSEYTRQELARYFSYPINKIYTAKLASSGDFYPRHQEDINQILVKFGLVSGQYSLFTGSIEPRKNIATLLDAYQRLPVSLRQQCPLVISGFKGWNSADIHRRFADAERQGWLRYLGYTSAPDLPYLFAGAKSFIFPSLYEGFGLPVLEAMASGVPVVCSNSSSLPEVVGDCALMTEAQDVEGLTAAIIRSLEDEQWRHYATEAGLARAKQFSWENCARETLYAYKMVGAN